jgi:hypothetical protein
MRKILFIHGLASSGTYKMADMLRHLMKPCEVIAPDLPIDPDEALGLLRKLDAVEKPDLVVGLSWGGFLALRLSAARKAVINPDLHISRILREHIGIMEYLSPRQDGGRSFLITEDICQRYEVIEKEGLPPQEGLLGCFADSDELVDCSEEFESLFPGCAFHYPGKHLPTYPEMKKYIVPAILGLLADMEGNAKVFDLGVRDGIQFADRSGHDE